MVKNDSNKHKKNLIYIIDNYSFNSKNGRVRNLYEIFRQKIPNVDVKVIHYSQVNIGLLKSSIGIILTGSKLNVSEFYNNKLLRNQFQSILQLIEKARDIPILAICYGLHLTGFAFKGKINRISIPHIGGRIISLSLKNSDELIPYKQIMVDIHHRDYISPDDANIKIHFEIMATKELYGYNTIQYMRHLERPIYSIQFHPETKFMNYNYQYSKEMINKTEEFGEEIIRNFAKICSKEI